MNAHDECEFAAFVAAEGDGLLRFVRLRLLDQGEAEDALQVALLRLTRPWSPALTSRSRAPALSW